MSKISFLGSKLTECGFENVLVLKSVASTEIEINLNVKSLYSLKISFAKVDSIFC